MITRAALQEHVREWKLSEPVVEKDYVLGWVLWGIGADPILSASWVFKGGTCLKKCYIETYRFSEDLDFTLLPGGPLSPEQVRDVLTAVLERVSTASGIQFDAQPPRTSLTASGLVGRIYYRGPMQAPQTPSIKLDLTVNETVVRPSVLRKIAHPFPDTLPTPATVRCYGFDELFAEKLRAMGERGRPRDLYDIVNLFRRMDVQAQPEQIRTVLAEKCAVKGVPIPTLATLAAAATRADLESEWANMLGHQLPQLPPFAHFWDALPMLFDWLEGRMALPALPSLDQSDDAGWTPPPTMWTWGAGVPLETIRFAGANHLCVALGYGGTTRVIEPYSLRRTRAGDLLLHAVRTDTREHRAYRVDRITQVSVTTQPFRPVYQVEFAQAGPIAAPPSSPRASTHTDPAKTRETMYTIECLTCGKPFRRKQQNLIIGSHKSPGGWDCTGRRGYVANTSD